MGEPTSAWDQLSSNTAQVLFCDLQVDIVKQSKTTNPQALASAAGALFQLAKLFSLPTLISVVPEGSNPPQLIAELTDTAGFAPAMPRATASLFGDAAITETIARSGRKILIVAGFMIEAVVLDTILDPHHERKLRACARWRPPAPPPPRSFPSAPSCRPTSRPNAESKCSQLFKASRSIERTAGQPNRFSPGHTIIYHTKREHR